MYILEMLPPGNQITPIICYIICTDLSRDGCLVTIVCRYVYWCWGHVGSILLASQRRVAGPNPNTYPLTPKPLTPNRISYHARG